MHETSSRNQGHALSRGGNGTWSTILVVGGSAIEQYFSSQAKKSLAENAIHLAHNGIEGLTVLDALSHCPEFLFFNVFMPDMDGIEFMTALSKRNYRGGIILVDNDNEDMRQVANDYAHALGLNVLGVFNAAQLEAINWVTAKALDTTGPVNTN